jgi:hypothetical protein
MARSSTAGYSVLGLALIFLAILVVVPMLKRTFPQFYEGYDNLATTGSRKPDCIGVTCAEGSFCQSNKCIPIFPTGGSM